MKRMNQLPGKRKPIGSTVVAPAIVSAVALETFLIATQEAVAIGLLGLIRVSVTAVTAVVAMSISVKVRTLWIVALVPLGVA